MKKFYRTILLGGLSLLLVACGDTSLKRADDAVGMLQEDVTALTNNLSEIQVLEENLQVAFEETLSQSNELSIFTQDDNPVAHNIQQRRKFLDDIQSKINNAISLVNELNTLKDNGSLPMDQFAALQIKLVTLQEKLDTYVTDYKANLAIETNSFQSIANPESDYANFFSVLKNINTLAITNNMNLEHVIPSFEPINIQLINLKVALVNMLEK